MEQDICIRAKDLSKIYKLYSSPLQMLLDKVGLGRALKLNPSQHAALDNITIAIRRGEKVAIIGRNGAGKSTFLKLVSGVSEPSSGTLEIKGKIHALLSIGSGFHQDFTGRQNVYAYLANQGVAGKQADAMLEEIIEFAEIEDYIDQPLRTYSTGMGVRLMFATSTSVAPDILILDEVLGVGDSYFAKKSYERMREMASGHGTTLLLVTHDIYSAVSLCERVIWIDRGKVLFDGPAKDAVAAYENSLKVQEEERLRIKNHKKKAIGTVAKIEGNALEFAAGQAIDVEIRPGNGMYFEAPFWLAEVELFCGDILVARWNADDVNAADALLQEGSQWGDFDEVAGKKAVKVKDYGNPYHKSALQLRIDHGQLNVLSAQCSIRANLYSYNAVTQSALLICPGSVTLKSQTWKAPSGMWDLQVASLKASEQVTTKKSLFYGTADIILTDVECMQNGKSTTIITPGQPFDLHVEYTKKNKEMSEECELVVGFHKDGIEEIFRSICPTINFNSACNCSGRFALKYDHVALGNGEYTISMTLAQKGYYASRSEKYFSINENIYCCIVRVLSIAVHSPNPFYSSAKTVVSVSPEFY